MVKSREKGKRNFANFRTIIGVSLSDTQNAGILDRVQTTFRTFKMYMYYGTRSDFGKGNFREFVLSGPV